MGKYIVTNIIIMTRKGKYMVREDIEKAPTHDHPCNLTRCVYSWTFIFQSLSIFHLLLPLQPSPENVKKNLDLCISTPDQFLKINVQFQDRNKKENFP